MSAEIFLRRYYGHCLACSFCNDACCEHGVDVSIKERDRILAHADELESAIGSSRTTWFLPTVDVDVDFPGAAVTRTTVVNGRCVFRRAESRGCALHAFAVTHGIEYHLVKPMVSALFPLTFGEGMLMLSEELADGTLVCGGDGPTAYEMARPELAYYFGAELLTELDALARSCDDTAREIAALQS